MKRSIIAAAVAAGLMAEAEAATSAGSAKAPKFCEKEYDLDTGLVSFAFGNGQVLEIDSNSLSAEMQKQLMLHGISQKVGDSFAGAKGNFVEGIAAAKAVIEQLSQGIWRAARGEGEARPRLGELASAIARIKGVTQEVAMAAVEKATDEQRKAWRGNAKVKATIAAIRAEEAQKALEAAGEQELQVDLG
jgi:hypothetical protein